MREREREEGGARAWSTWQTFKRLASLIHVDELARSIQVRVSRNPDLLCVSFRVAFSCQLSARAMIEIVAFTSLADLPRGGRVSNTATWRFADIWRPRGGLWKGLRSRLDGYFKCVFRTAGTCISAAHVYRWLLIAPSSTFQQPTVNSVLHFEYVSFRKFCFLSAQCRVFSNSFPFTFLIFA